ncbi:MAG: lactate racemase domain-containing protein [Christensenellales bacterium]|jgi:nickel-dependent lactate racemase
MQNIALEQLGAGISEETLRQVLTQSLAGQAIPAHALIVAPDISRLHSRGGRITAIYYELLTQAGCQVDVIPALGSHLAMQPEEIRQMFGPDIPLERFIVHDYRNDVVTLGRVPADFVREVSEGLLEEPIDVQVNRRLVDPKYGLILSVGQVVPHEVVGMANHAKNIFVGVGGNSMINGTHFLGAVYGMERIMGRRDTPVRAVLDYALEHFMADAPLVFALTVIGKYQGNNALNGLFISPGRACYEQAAALSQRLNLDILDRPLKKVVVYLEPGEFRSTWIGNKAIYRTRMAIADGGELIVLAPGVRQCGEDPALDPLLRKYGYAGRDAILRAAAENDDLKANLSAAAHLIHGSSDGRFAITYCPGHMTRQEVEAIHFGYMPYEQAAARYNPAARADGFNTLPDGEEIFYISNPALGLWALRERMDA